MVWSNISGSLLKWFSWGIYFKIPTDHENCLIINYFYLQLFCLASYHLHSLLQGQAKKTSPSAPAQWIAGPKPVTWNWSGFLTVVGKRPSWMTVSLVAAKRTLMTRTYSKTQIYVFMHASTFAMIMVVIILPISSISIYFLLLV